MSVHSRQRLKRALAAIAGATALAMTGSASASPGVPSAVFDPGTTTWESLRDFSSAAFAERFPGLEPRGMMVVDLDVDVTDGEYRVGAVVRSNPDGRGWASVRDLTDTAFHQRWEAFRTRGFRLVDQETYVHKGRRLFAGVWIENRETLDWASYRNVTSAQFSTKFALYRDRGFLPVDIDVARVGSKLRYSAVWVQNADGLRWRLRRDLTSAQLSNEFNASKELGLRTLVVASLATAQGQRYAVISIENRSNRRWYMYRDLTAKAYVNRWKQLRDMGYRLDGYEKYGTASGPRYAGIWRQNSSRPDWTLRERVDALVERERAAHDVPGISVAVSHHGELAYLRGFGYQDVDDGIWMHGESVHRTASVSKAVAGVLAMRMDAKHASLSLSDPVREHLPFLPAHHTYTVGQTVTNRSCVAHYPAPFKVANKTHYDTAVEAVKAFMDEPLVCDPGERKYSTAAYTVAAAVFEQLEGKPIDEIVLGELTKPFGLTTLRTENTAGSLPDRATLYTSDNEEYGGDDMTNKPLGGGLVSSALDLVRLGDGVLDGTILDQAQRTTMWTPPKGSYAYGWGIGTASGGQRTVGKSGAQPGAKSYLRIYPDDGILISVLSNRRGDHSPGKLSEQIGELVLAETP